MDSQQNRVQIQYASLQEGLARIKYVDSLIQYMIVVDAIHLAIRDTPELQQATHAAVMTRYEQNNLTAVQVVPTVSTFLRSTQSMLREHKISKELHPQTCLCVQEMHRWCSRDGIIAKIPMIVHQK